jgi:hypothetical protein
VLESKHYCRYFGVWSTKLSETIENGTPLPKGHGRLVDENPVIAQLVYREHLLADNVTCGEVAKIFDNAVVIEADKENDNG